MGEIKNSGGVYKVVLPNVLPFGREGNRDIHRAYSGAEKIGEVTPTVTTTIKSGHLRNPSRRVAAIYSATIRKRKRGSHDQQ